MTKKIMSGPWAILGALLLLLGPYQNCSLHQSEARKFLDDNGFKTGDPQDCLPYLSSSKVVSLFEIADPVSVQWVTGENEQVQCLISVQNNSSSGIDSVVCGVNADDKALVTSAQQNVYPSNFSADRAYQDFYPTSAGSGVWYSEVKNGTTAFYFIGAKSANDQAVRCSFYFSSPAEYNANKDKAITRGESLTKEMLKSL